RIAARERVDTRPAIASTPHAGENAGGHIGARLEATAFVPELDAPARCDAARGGIIWMDPQLGVRLRALEGGQGAAVVIEGVEGGQHAPLAKLERQGRPVSPRARGARQA